MVFEHSAKAPATNTSSSKTNFISVLSSFESKLQHFLWGRKSKSPTIKPSSLFFFSLNLFV
eukprot:m.160055 g.160055  ORF g.160055 m.160055 type:complete len:61 (+) comp15186_c4_seq2:2463-2645(+)